VREGFEGGGEGGSLKQKKKHTQQKLRVERGDTQEKIKKYIY